ncbi:AbrB/MazE/SpoVT family DNA-binding domain-containing protein [Papillibacter cinnamivorans]|uniref:SpoVT-AbrB domain-containing protein n=1 Tax=Papillibacter cinnamivorans DSM 12816 TaxID=1122930 RepID=A0A1W1YQ23_9FIRM|nr:AbrB/MazE/SpoVT family DNA-binding domain-containing protein [Papillibacter cinnamivorans]SMC38226.1 hypothetical protein SAMN02745168_0608 [Papillibacter cinnamivorans DSM 12816]
MKATGIVRKIDPLGRIVIPREILHTWGIDFGDPIEFFIDGDLICLRQYNRNLPAVEQLERVAEEIRLDDPKNDKLFRKALQVAIHTLKKENRPDAATSEAAIGK